MTENEPEKPRQRPTWKEIYAEAELILARTVMDVAAYPPEKVAAAAALVNRQTTDRLGRSLQLHANVTEEHTTRLRVHAQVMETHTHALSQR